MYPFMVREKKAIVKIIPSKSFFNLPPTRHHTIYGKASQRPLIVSDSIRQDIKKIGHHSSVDLYGTSTIYYHTINNTSLQVILSMNIFTSASYIITRFTQKKQSTP